MRKPIAVFDAVVVTVGRPTVVLLGMGAIGLVAYAWRRRSSRANRRAVFGAAILFVLVTGGVARGAPGDSWILPIADLKGSGWIEHAGAGYGSASAWEGSGMDGTRRAFWTTDTTTMPLTTELYTIEYYVPTSGPISWQPLESQIGGSAGEVYPMDPSIPWAGMYGTNHQYLGAYDGPGTPGTWHSTGPGPHAPESADYSAGSNGIYMWLHQGSWLYAKWDYAWPIDNTVSAIRLTQITATVPEPSSFALLGVGAISLLAYAWQRRSCCRRLRSRFSSPHPRTG